MENIHEVRSWITFNLCKPKEIQRRENKHLMFIEDFNEPTMQEKINTYFNPEDEFDRRERKSVQMSQSKWDFILNNCRDNSKQPRVIGIEVGQRTITDPTELTEVINKWGTTKWGEDELENLGNLKMIKNLIQDLDKPKITELIEKGLQRWEEVFSFLNNFWTGLNYSRDFKEKQTQRFWRQSIYEGSHPNC